MARNITRNTARSLSLCTLLVSAFTVSLPASADAASGRTYRASPFQVASHGPVLRQNVPWRCGTALRGGEPAKRFMRQQGRGCF